MKSKEEFIAILDIGATKIACLAGSVNVTSGAVKTLGISSQSSVGFKAGTITDLQSAANSIASVVENVENIIGEPIEKAIVSISGKRLSSSIIQASSPISNYTITAREIERIIHQGIDKSLNTGYELIHYFPISYSVDDEEGIKNPLDMCGKQLGCKLHVISAPSTLILNLANCMDKCRLDIEGFIVSPYASATACLTNDEIETGAIIVDIGGSHSSIAIFYSGQVMHTDYVPLGGSHITSDIAQGLSIPTNLAESVKIRYGNSVSTPFDEHKIIEISDSNHSDENLFIRSGELTDIIRPRLEEIFEAIRMKLEVSGLNKFHNKKIVLTGGTSNIMGIRELAYFILNGQVRLGIPNHIEGLPTEYRNPAFSTVIGMSQIIANDLKEKHQAYLEQEGRLGYLKKLFKWF